MQFDLRSFMESARKPYSVHFTAAFTAADFDGFALAAPAECDFSATPTDDGAALLLRVRAKVQAECARCLDAIEREYDFTRDYFVRPRDLQDPDFELPCSETAKLELEELAHQELIFEVPTVLLCSADCQGLCPVCGRKKSLGCTCQAAQAAPVDARLGILKQLLS